MKLASVQGWLASASLLCATAACHQGDAHSHPNPPSILNAPVPAPDGLAAEACARGPDALWGRLQHVGGAALARFPPSATGALAALAKVDLALAGEIDGAAPAYAVVTSVAGAPSLGWVTAVKLRDVEHAKVALLEGTLPRFTGRGADGGLVVLTAPSANAGAEGLGYVVAISPIGYLLAARSLADLVTLAPYATRTMPSRPVGSHALTVTVTHAALQGTVATSLLASLGDLRATAGLLDATLRQQHGGKKPDFGDPDAVMQWLDDFARSKVAMLANLEHAELTFDAGDEDVDVELSLVPDKGPSLAAFSALPTGDASPLLTLSAETEAAILFHDDPSTRAEAARALEERMTLVFKPALTARDTAAIHGAFTKWGAARGPWLTASLETEGSPALTLRTEAEDPDRATEAVGAFIDLARLSPFHAILSTHFGVDGVSTATAGDHGGGSTSVATFTRTGVGGAGVGAGARRDPGNGQEVAVAWTANARLLRVTAAGSSARALRASKDPSNLLGRDVLLAGKLGTLRDRSAFVLVIRPRLEPPDNMPGGPPGGAPGDVERPAAVLGIGHDKSGGWAMLEADDAIVREAVGRWLGL